MYFFGRFVSALQAAASTVKLEDDRKLFHNATLRKRRKEVGEQMEAVKRLSKVHVFWMDAQSFISPPFPICFEMCC